jgi:polar amino acid transport system substrate-binding protein
MKKFLCAVVAATMLFSMSGCGSANEGSAIVIGLDDEFPPMGFRDENNEIVGFDIDLAKAVGEKLGVEVEFQPIDWSAKEIELESGKVDVLWNGLTISDERKENMDFTDPYLQNKQIIIVKNDSDIQEKADLEGKNIGVQEGSTAVEAVQKDELAPSLNLFDYSTNVLAFQDLDIGRVDAVVADEVVARYYLENNGNDLRVVENGDFGDEVYGVAVKKGNSELLDELQTALDEIDKDGTAAEISNKWFGEDIFVHKG